MKTVQYFFNDKIQTNIQKSKGLKSKFLKIFK